MRDESELEASYSLVCFVRIFSMFCDSQTRKYPLFVTRITGALYVVCTETSYRATLRLHSFTPTICLSWFHLTRKSGGTEPYTWKWLGLYWIQVLWLGGGGRRRSCTSPRLDRRKHLDSCRGLAERVAATQCGTICGHKRNIWLFELCLLLKQLLRIFWIRKIKSHRLGGSVPQAELWCAVWRDIDSLMEPRSHWALRDLT